MDEARIPQLVFLAAHLQTGLPAFHQEARDALVASLRIGVGEDEKQPGLLRVGDPEFAAVQHPRIAIAPRPSLQREGIRASVMQQIG